MIPLHSKQRKFLQWMILTGEHTKSPDLILFPGSSGEWNIKKIIEDGCYHSTEAGWLNRLKDCTIKEYNEYLISNEDLDDNERN